MPGPALRKGGNAVRALLQYKFLPSVWGVVACLLLIALRFFGNAASGLMQAANALLLFCVLCISIHFVRGTAQLYDKHVWELPSLITLICMPVFNLLVMGLALIAPNAAFLRAEWFAVPLVFFSMPAFFCYYFIYVTRRFPKYKSLVVSSALLCAVGLGYILLRLLYKVVFPIAVRRGAEIAPALLRAAGESSSVSIAVYALSIVCFCILGFVFGTENRKEAD